MPAVPDHYAVLGLTGQATTEEVARAYRRMMRTHHPDTRSSQNPGSGYLGGPDPDVQAIMDAYSVLKDPGRRAAYDRQQRGQHEHHEPLPDSGRERQGRPSAPTIVPPPRGPQLLIGPVRTHPSADRTNPAAPTPAGQPPLRQAGARRGILLLALVLPTRVSPPSAGPGRENLGKEDS